MKKALLMLTGGRGVPEMLSVKYLQPDVVLNLTTAQGKKDAINLLQFLHSRFRCQVENLPEIDPLDITAIRVACETALQRIPDAEWTMTITSAPKIVSIIAYEVARVHNIPCLFLDTDGTRVISLAKELEVDTSKLFNATVEEYMGAYGRTCEIPKAHAYRMLAESWYDAAKILAHNPEHTQLLLSEIRKVRSLEVVIDIQAKPLLQQLLGYNMLAIIDETDTTLSCILNSNEVKEFLLGDWLEVYVRQETLNVGFADNCQWGYKIKADLPANELDLALTYKARLLIAECKSSKNPFKDSEDLGKLHSIANLVGRGYVRQVFITSCPRPKDKNEQFDNFCQQADVRHIVVITGDQLPSIGTLLQKEIGAAGPTQVPTYGNR